MPDEQDKEDKLRKAVALFRFRLVAVAVHMRPGRERMTFSTACGWPRLCGKDGLPALYPKQRNDRGQSPGCLPGGGRLRDRTAGEPEPPGASVSHPQGGLIHARKTQDCSARWTGAPCATCLRSMPHKTSASRFDEPGPGDES